MEEDFFIVRPGTGERVALGRRKFPEARGEIFNGEPKVGVVISTFGGMPYVEMGLAVRKLFYPGLPVLVHDDASGAGEQLQELCGRYGAEFETNSARLGHQMGDLSALVGGLAWAKERGIDLLVKMSRRFIPLTNWVPGLVELARKAQYPTYGNLCRSFSLPIRSECMAVAVGEWTAADMEGEIRQFMLENLSFVMAENYLVGYARKIEARRCDKAREWEAGTPEHYHQLGYATWDFVWSSRLEPCRAHLWHTANPAEAYAGVAGNLGLELGVERFKGDPNR